MSNLSYVALTMNIFFILLSFFTILRTRKMKYKNKYVKMQLVFIAMLSLSSYLIWNL